MYNLLCHRYGASPPGARMKISEPGADDPRASTSIAQETCGLSSSFSDMVYEILVPLLHFEDMPSHDGRIRDLVQERSAPPTTEDIKELLSWSKAGRAGHHAAENEERLSRPRHSAPGVLAPRVSNPPSPP